MEQPVVVRRRHDLAVTPRGTIERRGVMKYEIRAATI